MPENRSERWPISGCAFIRDSLRCAFMIPESLATALCFCDDVLIMDLGSQDGTLEFLRDVAKHNPRVRVVQGQFPVIDAGAFATLANDLVKMSKHDNVFYWQADEILHEDLFPIMEERFARGEFDLSFWRIQYRENFQIVKWFPHLIHAIGIKGRFNFVGDGMSTDRTWDAKICSHYGGEYFMGWDEQQADGATVKRKGWGLMSNEEINNYTHEMFTDVSLVGGFLENIPDRRSAHVPFWHESYQIEGKSIPDWMEKERQNLNWRKESSPFNLPALLKFHVGKVRYELRTALVDALRADKTLEFIQSL